MIYLVILAGVAILFSHILSRLSSKIPTQLIQIFVGVVVSSLFIFITTMSTDNKYTSQNFIIDPEIFIIIFIAPLLFRETEETDIFSLLSLRKQVVSISFILVFVTTIVIGFFVNEIDKTISLPAAFSLGAILGPIDAVAIFALLKNMNVKKDNLGIIKGEGLINDASGLICFSYAVMALNYNNFTLFFAGLDLVFITLGGLAVGIIIALLKRFVVYLMKRVNIKNASIYIIIEMVLPIMTCFFANELGMSGIIAAVSCAAINNTRRPKFDLLTAEVERERKSFWNIFTYIINALIFIVLGLELPLILRDIVLTADFTPLLFLIPILITFVLLLTRFVFVILFIVKEKSSIKNRLIESLFLTFAGPKGAFSLAMAFSLPVFLEGGSVFEQRNIILLFTAEIIIITLILSSVFLPLLTKKDYKRENEKKNATIDVLTKTIKELYKRKENEVVISAIIYYKGRLEDFVRKPKQGEIKKEYKLLKSDFFYYLIIKLKGRFLNGEVSRTQYVYLARILAIEEEYAAHPQLVKVRGIKYKQKLNLEGTLLRNIRIKKNEKEEIIKLYWDLIEKVFDDIIKENKFKSNTLILVLNDVINFSTQSIEAFLGKEYEGRIYNDFAVQNSIAFDIERKIIIKKELNKELNRNIADKMRVFINNIESHTLTEKYNNTLSRLITARIKYFKRTHSKKYLEKEKLAQEQLRSKIPKL